MNSYPHSSDIAVNSKAEQDGSTAKTGEEHGVRLASFVLCLMLCMFLISLDNVSHGASTAIGLLLTISLVDYPWYRCPQNH
jgi:hypothetical protein